jgi:hypothetical protein
LKLVAVSQEYASSSCSTPHSCCGDFYPERVSDTLKRTKTTATLKNDAYQQMRRQRKEAWNG